MNTNSIGGAMSSQLYQLPAQKSGGQVFQQPQPAAAQGPAEENKEKAPEQSREANSGAEGKESKSINLYA